MKNISLPCQPAPSAAEDQALHTGPEHLLPVAGPDPQRKHAAPDLHRLPARRVQIGPFDI